MGNNEHAGLAKRVKARFLMASTSEVYGDPEVHPQVEEYGQRQSYWNSLRRRQADR